MNRIIGRVLSHKTVLGSNVCQFSRGFRVTASKAADAATDAELNRLSGEFEHLEDQHQRITIRLDPKTVKSFEVRFIYFWLV